MLALRYLFLYIFLATSLLSFIQQEKRHEVSFDVSIPVLYEYSSTSPDNTSSDSVDFDLHYHTYIHILAELLSVNGFAFQQLFKKFPSFTSLIRAPPSISN